MTRKIKLLPNLVMLQVLCLFVFKYQLVFDLFPINTFFSFSKTHFLGRSALISIERVSHNAKTFTNHCFASPLLLYLCGIFSHFTFFQFVPVDFCNHLKRFLVGFLAIYFHVLFKHFEQDTLFLKKKPSCLTFEQTISKNMEVF